MRKTPELIPKVCLLAVSAEEWSVTLHSCTNTLNIINDSTAMNPDLLQLMHGRNDVPTCDMDDATMIKRSLRDT